MAAAVCQHIGRVKSGERTRHCKFNSTSNGYKWTRVPVTARVPLIIHCHQPRAPSSRSYFGAPFSTIIMHALPSQKAGIERHSSLNGLVIRNVKRDVKCQSVHGGADQSARQRAGNGSSALCSDTLGMLRPDPSSFTETMARERSQNTVRAFALSESTALVMCCV
jgi:hypothetical protein